jgi:AcrR family transcriptional regulator
LQIYQDKRPSFIPYMIFTAKSQRAPRKMIIFAWSTECERLFLNLQVALALFLAILPNRHTIKTNRPVGMFYDKIRFYTPTSEKIVQQRSEETHVRILQAALAQFSKDGYEASSVSQICQAASVSKGAFYHHFPSKQAVFQALLEGWLANLNAQMNVLLGSAPDVPTGLLGLAAITRPVFQDARGQFPMFLEFWTQSSRDPVLWQTAIAPYRHFQELFAGAIRKGIAEGSIRPVDAQMAAHTLLALAIGMVLQGIMDPSGGPWDQMAQQSLALLLGALKPVAGGQP